MILTCPDDLSVTLAYHLLILNPKPCGIERYPDVDDDDKLLDEAMTQAFLRSDDA